MNESAGVVFLYKGYFFIKKNGKMRYLYNKKFGLFWFTDLFEWDFMLYFGSANYHLLIGEFYI
ncbi:MAG: hypothetical protein ACJA2S_004634 [Cyclobacteriaceae bacterium]|jgi:hypothetical protein